MSRLKNSVRTGREGNRGWNAIFPLWPILIVIFVAGCSNSSDTTFSSLPGPGGGTHPVDFLSTHPSFAVSDVNACTTCHGDDLTGGIANVSCFQNAANCHHGTVPGWASPAAHGSAAKRIPGNSGYVSCQICHGADFTGGGALVSCVDNPACHGSGVDSPHPPAPWRGSARTHTDTAPQNAPVCALCHLGGGSLVISPPTPVPPGTTPGCFNNTLCHADVAAPHALGDVWRNPTSASFHGVTAKQDLAFCQTCHGTPGTMQFDGGAAATACSACHPAAKAHPIPWFEAPQPFPGYVASHRDAGNRNVACVICHKVDGPGAGPDPAAPSCFTDARGGTSCHANGPGNANHSVPFLGTTHTSVTQTGFDGNCTNCHSVAGTSPLSSAPLCTTCHQAGSPLTQSNCSSCHDDPPAGTAYPNVAGRHAKHDALTGVRGICTSCHEGLDFGTSGHYDRANARPGKDALRVEPGDAQFMAKFNAKSGTASFSSSAFACSNVSCHGGITTPSWRTGTISVNTNAGCLACHTLGTAQGTPENNSPFSGLHSFHLGGTVNALCTECHDMANGTAGALGHFTSLDTTQMEGPANQTLAFPGLTGASYDAQNRTCSLTCHGTTHASFSWSGAGGGFHAVPYLDPAHTQVTQAGFDGNCSNCHADTGTSPLSSAPLCTTCHQAGSPLTLANCTSCHVKPPAGTVYPDIAGRHAKHDALAGITDICTTCHNTFDSGTQAHYDRGNARPGSNALRVPPGDTNFLGTFSAKSGAASFDSSALTCSNMSCHGGVTTPDWRTGTIDVNTNTGCLSCHILGTAQGTPENNSPFSGRHAKHLTGLGSNGNAVCLDCHDMANGTAGATNHFAFLDTPQMEGDAGQTVEPLGIAANYNASNQSCTVTCHTRSHGGWLWEGPAASHVLGSAWTSPNPSFHGLTAKSDLSDCQACHSQPGTIAFAGGAAVTSCAACHSAARAHPIPWNEAPQTGFPPYTASHRNSGNQGVACAVCHMVDGPGTGPDPGAPSCFSASFNSVACHSGGPGGANHAVPNLDTTHFQAVQAGFDSNCSNCHSLTGTSPVAAAPNCASCHTNIASSSPLTTKNCTSCHADPPTGTTAYPNLERAHSEHDALTGVTGVCSACHDGLDPGTGASAQLAHYTRAKSKTSPGDVAILPTYNAKNATASFGSLDCSNVSCHGGQTINWTSSINVNTNAGCNQCHRRRSVSDQWNSPFSGDHGRGEHVSAGCTACHNTATLASGHFTNLATTAMEGPASATIGGGSTNISSGNYNTTTRSCNPSCHGTETW